MRDFETYAAHERLESYRANAARKLTRQQRAELAKRALRGEHVTFEEGG